MDVEWIASGDFEMTVLAVDSHKIVVSGKLRRDLVGEFLRDLDAFENFAIRQA